MAATHLTLVPFPATGIRPCSSSSRRSSDLRSLKTAASSSNSNWWTPLFGWSSEPDYIDSFNKDETRSDHDAAAGNKPAKTAKFAPGCFTAEKAKQLRMLTKETESFHDVMYHSAIASRLATDTRNRSDS